MDDDNELIELDLDFDFTSISPEDLLDSLGIPEVKTERLLDILKKGAEEAKATLQNFNREDMREYHGIGKRYAPIAFAIYGRLLRIHEEPRLPIYFAVNRFQATNCNPGTIIFWDDPDAIRILYESLEKDGYYACATSK